MRSKRSLNTTKSNRNPFLEWDRDGDELVRRPGDAPRPAAEADSTDTENVLQAPGDPWDAVPSPATQREPGHTPSVTTKVTFQERDRRSVMRLRIPQVIGRWLFVGILGGAVIGGLIGLIGGPIGFMIGFATGGTLGAILAVGVMLLALVSYTLRLLAGRPAKTSSQHVATWIVPPAILLLLPLFYGPAGFILTGPALFVGLIWGPSVVRKSLRPVLIHPRRSQDVVSPGSPRGPSRATPMDTTNSTTDSPQEVM